MKLWIFALSCKIKDDRYETLNFRAITQYRVQEFEKFEFSRQFQTEDMSNAMAYIMAPKEDSEISLVKKASQTTIDVFSKYLKEQIMDIIDGDKKVKHTKISEGIGKVF